MNPIRLHTTSGTPRVSSFDLSDQLDIQHKNVLSIVKKYKPQFENLNSIAFKTQATGGKEKRIALLTEDQSYFLLTLSRNSAATLNLKLNLVKAFKEARERELISNGHLPFHHQLHKRISDSLMARAREHGSETDEKIFHITYNKLINKILGIQSGERGTLSSKEKHFLTTLILITDNALSSALNQQLNHKETYQYVKHQLTNAEQQFRPLLIQGALLQ